MTEQEIYHSIRAGRLVERATYNDTTSGGLGLFPILCLWVMLSLILGYDFVNNRDISFGWVAIFISSSILLFYGSYKLINENKLTAIKTDVSASVNKSLMIEVLKKLNWSIIIVDRNRVVADAEKEWGTKTETLVVLMADSYLYINIKYKSGSKARLPFLTAYSEKKLREISKEIESAIHSSVKA